MLPARRAFRSTGLLTLSLFAVLAPTSVGQGLLPLVPFPATGDLYVCDSGSDSIVRLQDLNLDGDYNDAGEVVTFYSDILGPFPLTNNAGIAVGPDGTLYVCDTTEDRVFALRDLDGDDTAHGPSETIVWFDGTAGGNASGVLLSSPQDLVVDATGVVWVANTGTSGAADIILRLEDTGGLPGANDSGEAIQYYNPLPGGALGDSIPADVEVGVDGYLYYLENGATGALARGVYRLHDDVIPNGNCNDPGEVSPYFIPPIQANTAFHWGMVFDRNGVLYVIDSGNDLVWRVQDLNGNQTIETGTAEEVLWWTSPGASLIWMLEVDSDGIGLFAAESEAPDRILRLADDQIPNGFANDPGEVTAVWDETVSPTNITDPRSLAFDRRPRLTVPPAPSIGTVASVTYAANPGHLASIYYSIAPAAIVAPPFGIVELDLLPAPAFDMLYQVYMPPSGIATFTFGIPNDPLLIGATFYLQGLSGFPSRLLVSNSQMTVFAP